MKIVRLQVGIEIGEGSSLYYVTSPDFSEFDLGCGIWLNDAYFEIADLDVNSGIAGLYPLNEEAKIFADKSNLIYMEGIIKPFSVGGSNIDRRLIENGETHAEFEARKFNNKVNQRTECITFGWVTITW